eukprot:TRINITY_DN14272_c1_g1_i1.p1 TRINITY_DN14272_c1_g1~~TRINITY_DN14272_c1_g1_i1.p1  ORF type:complete len:412 (+),score=79.29 TRINITY_DN14272_c1_g1_i1:67-1302(+)
MAEKSPVFGKHSDVEAAEGDGLLQTEDARSKEPEGPDAAAGKAAPPSASQGGQEASNDKASPQLHMKALSLFVLTGSQALLPMQVTWTRRNSVESGGPLYLNTSVIVGAEAIKLVISFMLLCQENSSVEGAFAAVRQKFCLERMDTLKVAVPGFLYTIQAALVYYAMDTLSPPIYQVTYQLKILTTAMLSVVMLAKPLGCLKWFSLLLLTLGAALVQVGNADNAKSSSEKDLGAGIIGLIALLCACFTSGLAGVWLEKMLKQTKASIWMRNVQLAFFGFFIALVTAFAKDGPKIMEYGLFGGFGWREQLLTFHQGVTGLASAAVLKYADNILKCFAGVAAILIISVGTAISSPDSFDLDLMFVSGSGLVMLAICLYNLGCPTCATEIYEQLAQTVETRQAVAPSPGTAKVS